MGKKKRGRGYKWGDEDIWRWGALYVDHPRMTLPKIEEMLGVSHSTVWWCFEHRLYSIDRGLHKSVQIKLKGNRGRKEIK